MANRNYQTHVLCLFASVVVIQGFSPSISNQTPVTLLEPCMIWIFYQFTWTLYMTVSYHIHCRSFLAMSIPWNRDVLLYIRFFSGAFAHCQWNYRLSTGECPLMQWYGGFTWVFDPGINGGINLLDRMIIIRNRIGPSGAGEGLCLL
ncbi:hypothetical protein ISN44_As09g009320 [Arabidopsis suecica]|uniref:S-protein homolog n=1 Tax=Arabidopsis suecica TaxID=45249 RepID=A0A8T2AGG5_ARASU|nr:hypothetical protein ISN44_As09g009320 [Arabidopsis suecica]